jgi:hypothetical protein
MKSKYRIAAIIIAILLALAMIMPYVGNWGQ